MLKRGRIYSAPGDAVEFLQSEYAARCRKNPRYSLRAFAKQLNIHSGTLSKILSGKRGLSVAMAENMADCLKLDRPKKEWFVATVQLKTARSKVAREVAQQRLKTLEVKTLPNDVFRSIADWRHFATLAVAALGSVQLTAATLSRMLSLTESEATALLDRLVRLELLDAATLKPTPQGDQTWGPDGLTSEAVLNYHQSLLVEAQRAIREGQPETRDLTSGILSLCRSRFDDLRAEVRDFFKHVFEKYSNSEDADSVYALNIQCFELFQTQGRHESAE